MHYKKISNVFLIFTLIYFGIIVFSALTKPFIGYDDYYTLGIVKLSFRDMINATASNVHPPLYYLILKSVLMIFNYDNLIYVSKIVSIIPLGLILILIWTKVKNNWGYLVAGIFSLLICSSYQVMYFSTVIRMYSWALLFITIQFIYLFDILKENKKYSWIIFTIASICSIYTHYFSAIASIIIYLFLLFYLIINNKETLKIWFLSTIICILSYLPWLNILFNQISDVTNDYWIKPITIYKVFDYFQFIFSPYKGILGIILAIILLLILILLFYIVFKNSILTNIEKYYTSTLIFTIFITMLVGILLSILIRPIFTDRYILPVFGGLLFGFSILIAKLSLINKKYFNLLIIFILIISVISVFSFVNETNVAFEESNQNLAFLNSLNGENNIVIFNDPLSKLRYSPYLNNTVIVDNMSNYDKKNIILFDKHHYYENNDSFSEMGKIFQDTVYKFSS